MLLRSASSSCSRSVVSPAWCRQAGADAVLHDTYYVVATSTMCWPGAMFGIFAGFYLLGREDDRHQYPEQPQDPFWLPSSASTSPSPAATSRLAGCRAGSGLSAGVHRLNMVSTIGRSSAQPAPSLRLRALPAPTPARSGADNPWGEGATTLECRCLTRLSPFNELPHFR